MRSKIEAFTGLTFALLLAGCGGSEIESPEGEPVAQSNEPIIGGYNLTQAQVEQYGLVAVYHRASTQVPWFTRPCSGVILRATSTWAYVLTARHCLTVDENNPIDSALTAHFNIAVAPPLASPGPIAPGGQPPSFAVTPSSAVANPRAIPVDANISSTARDMALILINRDWRAYTKGRLGVLVRNPSTMVGTLVNAFGYGINFLAPNEVCYRNPLSVTGAGTARFGVGFEITSGSLPAPGRGTYSYPNLGVDDQKVLCGDSGGPDVAGFGDDDNTWLHIVGVHSSADTTATNTATSTWIQDQLGGLFVSSYFARDKDLAWNGPTGLRVLTKTSEEVTFLKYDSSTQRISVTATNKCLNSSLVLGTCTTATNQKWNVTAGQRIINVSTNQCLTHSGTSSLAMQACTSAGTEYPQRQMWAWHPEI